LGYLHGRLVAARDLLHASGSIFVQIGDENLHIVRTLLDDFTLVQLADGQRVSRTKLNGLPSDARLFAPDPLESASMGREKGEGAASWFRVPLHGREFTPSGQTR
jgi:hypothetical protein